LAPLSELAASRALAGILLFELVRQAQGLKFEFEFGDASTTPPRQIGRKLRAVRHDQPMALPAELAHHLVRGALAGLGVEASSSVSKSPQRRAGTARMNSSGRSARVRQIFA
jgi:hypothetical protein